MQKIISWLQNEQNRPFHWLPDRETPFVEALENGGNVLVLSPHPSDAERSAICLKRLMDRNWKISNCVCTQGIAGVLDRYVKENGNQGDDGQIKAMIRRNETLESARLLGLTEDAVEFLWDENGNVGRGDPVADAEIIENLLAAKSPDIVMLPSGNDENQTHRGVYQAFRRAMNSKPTGRPLLVLYHEDPKTIRMDPDLYVWFNRDESRFKSDLLMVHDSQQQRRMERAGEGLDDRILRCNFNRAMDYRKEHPDGPDYTYAEAFEIEVFD